MSVRTWLASRFRPRAAGVVPAAAPYWYLRHPWLQEAGVPINAETAPQVSAVYGCCRLIVDSLAAAPIKVYEVEKDGRRKVLHDDPVAYTLNWGAPIAQAPDAPTSQAIEEALYWSTLLHGNGYAEIQRDRSGKFFALWPIEPERVQPWRDENGLLYYRISQTTVTGGNSGSGLPFDKGRGTDGAGGSWAGGGWVRLDPRDMFHVRGPSLYGWIGDSTVYRAAKAIGIAQAEQVFAAAYFANGTVIGGVLSSDKNVTPDQAKRAIEQWNEQHKGASAAHGIAVTGQGLKFQPISHNAQESQLIEARRFQVQEIARFFGVPTTLLADNEAWTNLSELYLGFYRNALLPWAERFDAEATRKLFPQRQPWREVRHDLTELVMGSFKDRIAALRVAVDGGLWTRNEARELTGKNHVGPEGDVLVVGGATKTLEDVLDPPEPKTLTEGPAPDPGTEPDEPELPAPPVKARPASSSVARVAVALDRFERSMTARRADVERNAPEKLEANLMEHRKKLEAALLAECRKAMGVDSAADSEMRVLKAADAVLAGEPAHLAAERLAAA